MPESVTHRAPGESLSSWRVTESRRGSGLEDAARSASNPLPMPTRVGQCLRPDAETRSCPAVRSFPSGGADPSRLHASAHRDRQMRNRWTVERTMNGPDLDNRHAPDSIRSPETSAARPGRSFWAPPAAWPMPFDCWLKDGRSTTRGSPPRWTGTRRATCAKATSGCGDSRRTKASRRSKRSSSVNRRGVRCPTDGAPPGSAHRRGGTPPSAGCWRAARGAPAGAAGTPPPRTDSGCGSGSRTAGPTGRGCRP